MSTDTRTLSRLQSKLKDQFCSGQKFFSEHRFKKILQRTLIQENCLQSKLCSKINETSKVFLCTGSGAKVLEQTQSFVAWIQRPKMKVESFVAWNQRPNEEFF